MNNSGRPIRIDAVENGERARLGRSGGEIGTETKPDRFTISLARHTAVRHQQLNGEDSTRVTRTAGADRETVQFSLSSNFPSAAPGGERAPQSN